MIEYPLIPLLAILMLSYGIFSKVSERSIFSGPMFFLIAGIALSYFNLSRVEDGIEAHSVKIFAEITLILVLFSDASSISLKALIEDKNIPVRLLFIGLPLTMAIGVLIAILLFPEIKLIPLIIMALILSPTDAALGVAVVKSDLVPLKIRQAINVESGLNDGIALPPILVCMALISGSSENESGINFWLLFTLKQFIYGPLIGGSLGWISGKLIEITSAKGLMNQTFQRLASLGVPLIVFYLAEKAGGNGFIAAFFSGLLFGTQSRTIRLRIQEFGEAESQLLALSIFFLTGLILIPFSIPYLGWRELFYSILSLTVIRMLPAALSLTGTELNWYSKGFIAWFGPRGIASILYLLLAVINIGVAGHEKIYSVISLTVGLSIIAHGMTAIPFTKLFSKQ